MLSSLRTRTAASFRLTKLNTKQSENLALSVSKKGSASAWLRLWSTTSKADPPQRSNRQILRSAHSRSHPAANLFKYLGRGDDFLGWKWDWNGLSWIKMHWKRDGRPQIGAQVARFSRWLRYNLHTLQILDSRSLPVAPDLFLCASFNSETCPLM